MRALISKATVANLDFGIDEDTTKGVFMKPHSRFVSVLCLSLLLAGCCSDIKSAINSYAAAAEEQATVMQLNLDNCLKASDPSKDASCDALRNNIKTYRKAAQELKTNTGS